MSPALSGGFSTTAPPRKPCVYYTIYSQELDLLQTLVSGGFLGPILHRHWGALFFFFCIFLFLYVKCMLHNGRLFFLFTTLFLMPRKCLAHESFRLVAQLCLTLCNPMDCRLQGSSIHGIFQARVLEWVAMSFSRGSSRPRDLTRVSHVIGRHFTVWATRVLNKYYLN